MFYGIEERSSMNHWFEFAAESPEMERLFYMIRQLIEDMIKELLPQLFKEYSHLIDIEVITALNGRKVDLEGIEQAIIEYIQKYLTSNFKH